MAADLITNMLCINPFERYNSRECLQHPFFNKLAEADTDSFPKCPRKYDWGWYEEPANADSI